jgi:hypothetical protein
VSEKQAFSVLVRALGVLVFLVGLRTLWFLFAQGLIPEFHHLIEAANVAYGIVATVLGATMIRWPQWVVLIAWLRRLPTIGRME